jgi:hypothetical protein
MAKIVTLLLGAVISLSCQTAKKAEGPRSEIVSVPDLGFRYTPPPGMKDKTTPASKQLRGHAAAYAAKAAEPILDLVSDGSDTSPEWHQVWVFLLPRAQLANVSEAIAEGKVNTALAGPNASPVGQPQTVTINGRSFFMSEFEQNEPPLLKHAKIYTAICKSQLISFIFVSNSAGQVKGMEQSLKTLDFSGQ